MKTHNKLLVSMAVSLALYGPVVYSAQAEESKQNEAKEDVIIGEWITVTAQKRSEKLVEVPVSMSVLNSEAIDQTGMTELSQLGDMIPNLKISQGDDFESRISIRGVGAQSRNIGFDSRVGVYIDGVYLGQSPAVNQDLVDLEQVEVLRGPQGTIFGKNTVAGAISLISVKPHDTLEGSITTNFANYNGVEIKGDINIPLSETLFLKAAASTRTRDGYVDNVYNANTVPGSALLPLGLPDDNPFSGFNGLIIPGFSDEIPLGPSLQPTTAPVTNEKYNDIDTQSYRLQVRFKPSDQLDINFAFDGLQSERRSATAVALTDTFGVIANPDPVGKHQASLSATPVETRDIFGTSLTIDYNFENDYSFKSITAYRDTEASTFQDIDFSVIDYLTSSYTDQFKQTTQEFQILSPNDADFKYVVGLYLYSQEGSTNRRVDMGNASAFVYDQGPDHADDQDAAVNIGTVDTTSVALFMNGSYQLDDKWKLGFGLRYSEEEKEADWSLDGPNINNVPITDVPEFKDSREDTNLSPMVSINYALNDDSQVYAKYSTGFKSGGYNLDWVDDSAFEQGLEFDKETVVSYELGYKAKLFDNALSISSAVFMSNYDDYQVNQYLNLGDDGSGRTLTAIQITNAAKVETSGIELEATYLLTDSFTINATLGLLDATFDDFPGGMENPETGDPVNAAGNRLPFASEVNGSIGFQYYQEINALNADLLVRVVVAYNVEHYTDISNQESADISGNIGEIPLGPDFSVTPLIPVPTCMFYAENCSQDYTVKTGHIDSYVLVNARIGLIDMDDTWEVYLWGRNLTDEDQIIGSSQQFFGTFIDTNQTPRTYGIEGIYRF